jgi:hypothetical protein
VAEKRDAERQIILGVMHGNGASVTQWNMHSDNEMLEGHNGNGWVIVGCAVVSTA